jgi:hypothetical protein
VALISGSLTHYLASNLEILPKQGGVSGLVRDGVKWTEKSVGGDMGNTRSLGRVTRVTSMALP